MTDEFHWTLSHQAPAHNLYEPTALTPQAFPILCHGDGRLLSLPSLCYGCGAARACAIFQFPNWGCWQMLLQGTSLESVRQRPECGLASKRRRFAGEGVATCRSTASDGAAGLDNQQTPHVLNRYS